MVAQVDLMTTPTQRELAGRSRRRSTRTSPRPWSGPRERRWRRSAGLRIQPTINVNPERRVFSFALRRRPRGGADIDATLERLLELPAELGGASAAAGSPW